MKIGLIDVDGHNFPNLPLMKLSAWHKKQGDYVEWYQPLFSGHMDMVYMSKVFSFTQDYEYFIDAGKVIKSGSGYAIKTIDGKEVYDKSKDADLPFDVEHIYPDYSLYPKLTKDTAYGFLTRGCQRNCKFCHTTQKDGAISHKVADLSEFWDGQKNIVLLDQNILASNECIDLLQQLIESKAYVEFNGGLDVRIMTEEKAFLLKQIKIKMCHFALDRYEDITLFRKKAKMFREITGWDRHKITVYVLVNFDTSIVQDLERIQLCRELDMQPFVMIYDKQHCQPIHKQIQRWCNPFIFWKVPSFSEYNKL